MAGQLTISGLAGGLQSGSKVIGPMTIVGASVVGEVLDLNLASGDTTIAVPPGAIAVVIVPPTANTQTLKVRSNLNSGDAGLPVSVSDPFLWSFRGLSPTSIIINAGSTVNGVELTFV